MLWRNVNSGEFVNWNGLYLIKLDDYGAAVINHPSQSGAILDLNLNEEVVPFNCEMKFTKRKE